MFVADSKPIPQDLVHNNTKTLNHYIVWKTYCMDMCRQYCTKKEQTKQPPTATAVSHQHKHYIMGAKGVHTHYEQVNKQQYVNISFFCIYQLW